MRTVAKLTALLLALTTSCALTNETFAGSSNPLRDLVEQREAAVMQRVLGPELVQRMQIAKIVGGKPSAAGRWPFQVALLHAGDRNNYRAQFCGGSIIDDEFILTAGHCAKDISASEVEVLTGTQSLIRGGTRRAVRRIQVHPRYNGVTFDFDVALIQLKQKITDVSPAQRAVMIAGVQENKLAPSGTKAMVIGWGSTLSRFPTELRAVSIPIVSTTRCNSKGSYHGEITERMLCAGLSQGGRDSCQGDSGGPLVVAGPGGRLRLQAGIVSWGESCALPNFYGVYSRLAVLEPWVSAKMEAWRAPSASDLACDISGGRASSPACRRAAKDEAEREIAAYLDTIKRRGSRQQASETTTEQRAWSQALGGVCAFEAALDGNLGREDCVAREARKRADALVSLLSKLPN